MWQVPAQWRGRVCFIVASGPTILRQNLDLLHDKNTIVINSTYKIMPDADFLFFGDQRWWRSNHNDVCKVFNGRIVTIHNKIQHERVLNLIAGTMPKLSVKTNSVTMRRTSVVAAMNLAMLMGVKKIVLLGVDCQKIEGKIWHHKPHHWDFGLNVFEEQIKDFEIAAPQLKKAGVEIVNASPDSALDVWPMVEFESLV